MDYVPVDRTRLERCSCGAIVRVLASADGETLRLEAHEWPWPDLPDDARYLVVDGEAVALPGAGSAEQLATLEHARACPRVVRRRPPQGLVRALWEYHHDKTRPKTPLDPHAGEWAALRRNGTSTQDIAERAGVTHQWVSRVTKPLGPFPRPGAPTPETVKRWVSDRRAGLSALAIAERDQVPVHRVRDATRPFGPFTRRVHKPGEVGITEIADLLGVGHPTIYRWHRLGRMPAPIAGRRGFVSWPLDQVQEWAEQNLTVCAMCEAKPMDLLRHMAMKHPRGLS